MKLISVNIELHKHRDTILDFLKKENPDVICLQELLETDFDRFRNELSMEGIFKVRKCVNHPHYMDIHNQKEGVAIFAKNITASGYVYYEGNEEHISGEDSEKNAVLVWGKVIDAKGITYTCITSHLPATKDGATTPLQLEIVDKLIVKLETFGEFIFCGDMNAPRGQEAFSLLAEKYTDNIPEKYKVSLDKNLHRVKGLPYMVDGLFTTPAYKATDTKLVDGVSDHMAIVANIKKKL